MRVAVVTHLFPSADAPGRGTFVLEQVKALSCRAEVTVVVPWAANRIANDLRGVHVIGLGMREPKPATGRLGYMWWAYRYRRHLLSAMQELAGNFDVIHAHFAFPDGTICADLASASHTPFVVTLHGSDVSQIVCAKSALGGFVRRKLAGASALICVSEKMKNEVLCAYSASVPRVLTVRNGYDESLFCVAVDRRVPDVLFVGALREVKQPNLLIEAFAMLAASHSGRLHMVGDGPMRGTLENMVRHLGLTERVCFHGQVTRERVATMMKESHVVVLPSRREGMPMVVIEALACGTPVVATRVGGIAEVLREGCGVLMSPIASPEDIAAALADVLGREWDPYSVREASGARPWSSTADDLVDVYSSVLSAGGDS